MEDEKDKVFWWWFDQNMIYCGDTHSFVHRMYKLKDTWDTYKDAQQDAFKVIKEMKEEFNDK